MSYPIRGVCVIESVIVVGRGIHLLVLNNEDLLCTQKFSIGKTIFSVKKLDNNSLFLNLGKSFRIAQVQSGYDNCTITGIENEIFLKYWIIDALKISHRGSGENSASIGDELLLLLSSNIVVRYTTANNHSKLYRCDVPCILYSGLLFEHPLNGDIFVFSGTVFNTVLIWKILKDQNYVGQKDELMPVYCSLMGHDGVIFDIDFDWSTGTVVTASDDRSVRIWSFSDPPLLVNCSSMEASKVYYCHKARIQRVKFFGEYIISAGEDCLVCVITPDAVLAKFSAHRGMNIFGLDVNLEQNIFVTGGEDGALLRWSAEHLTESKFVSRVLPISSSESDIRLVKNLNDNEILILSTSGKLIVRKFQESSAITEHQHGQNELLIATSEVLSYYAVCDVSSHGNFLVFGSLYGRLLSLKLNASHFEGNQMVLHETGLSDSRINSVHIINDSYVLGSSLDKLYLLSINSEDGALVKVSRFNWPVTKNNWPNCCALIEDGQKLICGDRNGTLWVYIVPEVLDVEPILAQEPVQVITRAHSKLGLMDLVLFESKLFTSGRDGKINVYHIVTTEQSSSFGCLQLSSTFQLRDSIDWISKLKIKDGKLFAFCFKSENFVLVDIENSRTITKIPCGGGHRNFDLRITIDGNKFQFSFLKKSEVSYLEGSFEKVTPYKYVLPALHGMKIHCVEVLTVGSDKFVITGAEDNSIRISILESSHLQLVRTLACIDTTPCIVRSVKITKIKGMRYLLLAFGSRCLKSFYELNFAKGSENRVEVCQIGFECSTKEDETDDCKYLSADVLKIDDDFLTAIASSDGHLSTALLRSNEIAQMKNLNGVKSKVKFRDIFSPGMDNEKTAAINVIKLIDRCHINEQKGAFAIFGDNFGVLRCTELSVTDMSNQAEDSKCTFEIYKYDLSNHLGRITCMDIVDQKILVGGDSAGLVLCSFDPVSLKFTPELVVKHCHAAQIVNCHFITSNSDEVEIASLSIDQRIKVFTVSESRDQETNSSKCDDWIRVIEASNCIKSSHLTGIEDPYCSVYVNSSLGHNGSDVKCDKDRKLTYIVAGQGLALV